MGTERVSCFLFSLIPSTLCQLYSSDLLYYLLGLNKLSSKRFDVS